MSNLRAPLIVLLVLLMAMFACGSETGEEATIKTATPEPEAPAPTEPPTEPAPTEPAAPQPSKLGDTVEQDGYTLSAVTVEDPAVPDDLFYEPEPGTKLVGIEIVVGCTTCETASVNALYAKLVDSEGFSHEVELGALAEHDQIATTDIGPGEKVKGWVAFELPENGSPTYLKYQFELFTGPTLQVGVTP